MARRYIPCAVNPALNKIVFEITNPEIPITGKGLFSYCGRKGVVVDFTPNEISVKWEKIGTRTYTDISFGQII
jgi:hypothetical protein